MATSVFLCARLTVKLYRLSLKYCDVRAAGREPPDMTCMGNPKQEHNPAFSFSTSKKSLHASPAFFG